MNSIHFLKSSTVFIQSLTCQLNFKKNEEQKHNLYHQVLGPRSCLSAGTHFKSLLITAKEELKPTDQRKDN